MSVAYVGITPGTAVTATSISVTRSHTAGNASVFIVHTEGALTGASFDGTPVNPFLFSKSSSKRIYAYVQFNVAVGNHTWVANQGSARIMASIIEASGALSVGAFTATYTSAGSTAWTMTINPVAAAELMIAGDSWEYGHSSHGAPATNILGSTYDSSLGYSVSYKAGGGGSTSLAFTSVAATPVDALGFFLSNFPAAGQGNPVAITPFLML